MDAHYYRRDVRRAKEQEFLRLKQREMSIIEYATKFNELSCFAPSQVAIEEIRVDNFKQGLKGEVKQTIAGHAYVHFQEIYQTVVKVSLIMNETETENRGKGPSKEKVQP